MKQPKYNIGDKVWRIDNNETSEEAITGVFVEKGEIKGGAVFHWPHFRIFLLVVKWDVCTTLSVGQFALWLRCNTSRRVQCQ